MGARVVVATPGRVDPDTFANPNATPEQYNANLAELRERARALAWERGLGVADVNAWMGAAIDAGKGALGVYYDVAGPDGVHPRENGHLAIALAMLQGLGVDGTIARIEWDPASGSASASEGHRVIASSPTALELESTRYPFGFWGDPRSADGTRGMAQLIPFNTLVNRFELVVKNAPPRARLWWGTDAVVITADRLARGVNLAELFTRYPTDEQFFVVDAAVGRKQALEREIVKLKMPAMKNVESERAPLEKLWKKMDEEAKAAVRPVRHTIRIEPVE
jgi:hypothetical protein